MSRTNARPVAIRTAFRQMPRATAMDLCEDYREVVTRLKRMADNLASAFVVASGDSARALEAELRMFEEAITDSCGKASLKIAATTAVASAMTGDLVAVSGIGSGVLSLHGSSQSNSSLGSSKLTASLTGIGTGKAELETKGTKQKFEVEMRGLSPNPTYDVTIDGVLVGKLSTNKSGKAELKFDSSKGRPFPSNFPTITASSVISIGTATSGSFAAKVDSRHR